MARSFAPTEPYARSGTPVAALLAASLSLASCATSGAPTPAAPAASGQPAATGVAAVEAPHRLALLDIRDAFIVPHEPSRTYYLYATNNPRLSGEQGVGTMVYTSKDLRHWTRPTLAFRLPEDVWADAGAWAPEVHQWRGRWYLFSTFHNEAMALPPQGRRTPHRRGTILAVADHPAGPYMPVRDGEPIVPADRMTLDGHLFVEDGQPWLVYAREWVQVTDGMMELIPLTDDLAAAGPPRLLFRASDAPWVRGQPQAEPDDLVYVTDAPWLHRSRTGELLMLWSSYGETGYAVGQARSRSGKLEGPWDQLPVLLEHRAGHPMLFRSFEGELLMHLHRGPNGGTHGELWQVQDAGDRIEIVRRRTDLDGGVPAPGG